RAARGRHGGGGTAGAGAGPGGRAGAPGAPGRPRSRPRYRAAAAPARAGRTGGGRGGPGARGRHVHAASRQHAPPGGPARPPAAGGAARFRAAADRPAAAGPAGRLAQRAPARRPGRQAPAVAAAARAAEAGVSIAAYRETARPQWRLRAMREGDLDAVMAIEKRAYPFPWTRGIFRDCLLAGYPALLALQDDQPAGYGVMSIAADEAHVLNLCTAPERQSRGLGRYVLRALLRMARDRGAH